jgi:hypothetical protein
MPQRDSNSWFLKDRSGVRGPLSESEMRAAVTSSTSSHLQVRQGTGRWYSSDVVRKKIETLAARGIYIKFGKIAEGPFTLTKAYELLQTVDHPGIKIRTGRVGRWVTAEKWLSVIAKLQHEKQREVQSITAALQDVTARHKDGLASSVEAVTPKPPATPTAIPMAIPVGVPQVAAPSQNDIPMAILVPDQPAPTAIPMAIPVVPVTDQQVQQAATIPVAIPIASPRQRPRRKGS